MPCDLLFLLSTGHALPMRCALRGGSNAKPMGNPLGNSPIQESRMRWQMVMTQWVITHLWPISYISYIYIYIRIYIYHIYIYITHIYIYINVIWSMYTLFNPYESIWILCNLTMADNKNTFFLRDDRISRRPWRGCARGHPAPLPRDRCAPRDLEAAGSHVVGENWMEIGCFYLSIHTVFSLKWGCIYYVYIYIWINGMLGAILWREDDFWQHGNDEMINPGTPIR